MAIAQYWRRPAFLAALAWLTALPLLSPETPPLVDLPGHLGRYRIQLDVDTSANLQQFFAFEWGLIANLGVDLLIIPLAPVVGLETAVKLIVLAIPPLTTAGILWMAHEAHREVPPTALLAIPFTYSFPFNFGFINFALAIALAFLAFGYWLRLSRQGRVRLQIALFVPLSCLVWVSHAFGWGVLGVLVWGSEFALAREHGRTIIQSVFDATLRCAPVATPMLLMALWRAGDAEGVSTGFFQFDLKLFALVAALRDRWLLWDAFSIAVPLVLLAAPSFDRRFSYVPTLAIPALLLAALVLLLPAKLFGSAYADSRLAPVAMMVALAAIRLSPAVGKKFASGLAVLGCLFIAARLTGNYISMWQARSEARNHLAVLEALPMGSRVLFLVEQDCGLSWALPRNSHLGSFVIARRHGFSNDQWDLAGSQLMHVIYDAAADYRSDPSQFFIPDRCSGATQSTLVRYAGGGLSHIPTIEFALARLPREAFDYVWVIASSTPVVEPHPELALQRQTSSSVLFKVKKVDRPDI